MKQPPTIFATPSATSSRLALREIPSNPSPGLLPPRLLAATQDSKNPSNEIKKEVPIASRMCVICDGISGNRKGNGAPVVDSILPNISTPLDCQSNPQANTAESTTTTKRSGTYATFGYLGWRYFFTCLSSRVRSVQDCSRAQRLLTDTPL